MASFPAVTTLPHASDADLRRLLDLLFEPSPHLHALVLPILKSTTFPSYPALASAIHSQLTALATSTNPHDLQTLSEILSSHPRLGDNKVESEQSRAEQAQLQQGAQEEKLQLAKWNAEYEVTFPGLRYVVFVNGRPRSVIMEDMRSRIHRRDIQAERLEAIQAMCDIAVDRAQKLQKRE